MYKKLKKKKNYHSKSVSKFLLCLIVFDINTLDSIRSNGIQIDHSIKTTIHNRH